MDYMDFNDLIYKLKTSSELPALVS